MQGRGVHGYTGASIPSPGLMQMRMCLNGFVCHRQMDLFKSTSVIIFYVYTAGQSAFQGFPRTTVDGRTEVKKGWVGQGKRALQMSVNERAFCSGLIDDSDARIKWKFIMANGN